MVKQPRLSIIIPVFNDANALKRCLDSLCRQTVAPFEVVIVNNNCTDRSMTVARTYPSVKIVKQTRQGIVFARNTGFAAARGDILGRIDADTMLPPNWVETVLDFYTDPEHSNHALTGGGFFYNIRLPKFNGWILGQLAFRTNRFVIGHYILWGSNMAMPATMWHEVKPDVCMNEHNLHEDMDLAIHCHRKGYKITYHESLRVGVKLKRVWEDRWEQRKHLARWPRTLRLHGYKLWWMGSLGNVFLVMVGEPFIFISEGVARLLGRPKLPK